MNVWNPHNYLEHHGVKGQKWGIRNFQTENGTWTELGKERRRVGRQQKETVVNLINTLNTEYDYGVIIDGKRYDEDLSDVDWSKYRTMPVEKFEKEKIGVCWDFVNYQHYICDKNGIPNKNYMIVCQRSNNPNDILTHTFTVASIEGKQYWIESSRWKDRGVHEIQSVDDVFKSIQKDENGLDCDLYEFNPTGMDKNLTDQEYFDKATENLVYSTALKHYEVGTGYGPRQTSYASKYYDPVKAHEYYERTKQLKGRTRSVSSLDDEGKQMWSYVKEQITNEKQSKTESLKQELATSVAGIQAELSALRNLSGQERGRKKAEIQSRIKALRTQLASKKEQLQAELQSKQKEVADQKSSKSREIQNENRAITEYIQATNKQASESVKIQNAQKSEQVKSQKAAKQNELTKLREKLKTTTDKEEKAKLREEIAKKSANKKEFSDKASAELANYKATNNASLAAFKESNSQSGQAQRNSNSESLRSFKEEKQSEMNEFRAANKADVKSATERTTAEITKLRDSLTKYNEDSRAQTTEKTTELRSQIKALREANAANRKLLTEEYKNIQNDEFDKIAESHTKKKK